MLPSVCSFRWITAVVSPECLNSLFDGVWLAALFTYLFWYAFWTSYIFYKLAHLKIESMAIIDHSSACTEQRLTYLLDLCGCGE